MSVLLELRGVTKHFGGVEANRNISLDVAEGAIVGLIGPNGSGKTTLFNSIVGQHPIDAGSIRYRGKDISHLRIAQIARRGLLRTYQQTHVYRRMNCVDNLLISAPHRHGGAGFLFGRIPPHLRERAEGLLDFVGLYAKRRLRAGDLSFGQQKLLELAMALMNEPRLLLLDEPTAGINPTLIHGLLDRLRQVNAERGVTLFVIEHNMRVVMNLVGYVHCLARGELLASGTPAQVQGDRRVIDAYLGAQ